MSDVLRFATEEAASAVGLEKKVGSLDVGYSADFIVLESDPLEVPNTLGRPIETWVEGEKAL
jgi:imidazolonepropionase-like amidohydrolase